MPAGRDVFGRESVPLLTAAEAAALDREAQDRRGVPGRVLMENAGRAAALVLQRLHPRGRVVAAVGGGNNGGDALVLLRTLRAWGREVAWVQAGSRAPDAALAHGFELPAADAAEGFAAADVLVDGILGTGATGAPREPAAGLIEAMNRTGLPILAIDLPSGVDPTSGAVPGAAIHARWTVTFGWPKVGLMLQPARAHCGRLVAVEIGFPPISTEQARVAALITPAWAAARLPLRPPDAHKGTAGQLLVLAGRQGMAGAAAIAGRAALRAGAGYVRLGSVEANRAILQLAVPDAVFADREDAGALGDAAAAADALLVGPGFGLDERAAAELRLALEASAGKPTLLDADALTLLGREAGALRRLAGERALVLTPHPGEMSRLTGLSIAEVRADPVGVAARQATELGCVVLLKGAPSVVAAPGEPVLVNTTGSSDLAAAGMGDEMAGAIGGLLAQGAPPRDAAATGLFFSSRAADLAALGRSLRPDDVSEHLPRAFAAPGLARSPLELPFVTFDQPPRW